MRPDRRESCGLHCRFGVRLCEEACVEGSDGECFPFIGRDTRSEDLYDSYLVDPASSHMLVSKIKPCMSKYKRLIRRNCEWLIKSVIVYLIVPLLG